MDFLAGHGERAAPEWTGTSQSQIELQHLIGHEADLGFRHVLVNRKLQEVPPEKERVGAAVDRGFGGALVPELDRADPPAEERARRAGLVLHEERKKEG